MRKTMKKRRPRFEGLEDRRVPATWGVPWADPQHLTVSFVPDGTQIQGQASQLTQTLGGSQAVAGGEAVILKALQTWAANSNINLGVVPDGGQPIGTAGPAQGDARFGDIRVGAAPLPSDVVAITSSFDPAAGTLSGDIIFNSKYDFNPNDAGSYDLFTVALHESGHVFGFADSSDPTSFMYDVYQGPKAGLDAGAVAAVQSLYGGARSIDAIDGTHVGTSPSQAVGMANLAPNATSVTASGDLATPQDANFFRVQAPPTSLAPLGFDVQVLTSGLSLLAPKVTVLDPSGNVVATASASGLLDGGTSVHLATPPQGVQYTIEVQGATGDVLSVGSYQFNVSVTGSTGMNASNPTGGATNLPAPGGYNGSIPLTASKLINHSKQAETYSFKTLASNPYGVTVNVQDWGVGLASPTVTVYNAAGVAVASSLASDPTISVIGVQVPSVLPNATYYVRVTNGTLNSLSYGMYRVSVAFTSPAGPQSSSFVAAPLWLGGSGGSNASNASLASAANLATPSGLASQSHYVAIAGIGPTQTQQFYKLDALNTNSNMQEYMTVSVQTLNNGSMLPWISALDQAGNALTPRVLTEKDGVAVVQIALATTGGQYSLEVSALQGGGGQASGNYILNVTFGTTLASLGQIAAGTIGPVPAGSTVAGQSSSLTISQGQISSFVLTGSPSNGGTDAILRMTLTNSSGNVVATLTTPASQAESMVACLPVGAYTVLIDAYSPSGQPIPKLAYALNGTNLTDPIKVRTTSGSGGGTMG